MSITKRVASIEHVEFVDIYSLLSIDTSSSTPGPTTQNSTMAAVQPNLLHQVYNQSLLSRRAMPADVALVMYKRAIGVVQGASRI